MDIFSKYQGLGNDFIVFDVQENKSTHLSLMANPQLIRQICHRRFGIGADGIVFAISTEKEDHFIMKIFNSDGSEAEMCGNGIRCMIQFLFQNKRINHDKLISIDTLAGNIKASVDSQALITVDMGTPNFNPDNIPTTLKKGEFGLPTAVIELNEQSHDIYAVGMGNPHLVLYTSDLNNVELNSWGSLLEKHSAFPSNTNVHFVNIVSNEYLEVLVWERGCGPTLACGTGACACLAVTHLLGLCKSQASVKLPGGVLDISWKSKDSNIFMKGPAELVYIGQIELNRLK